MKRRHALVDQKISIALLVTGDRIETAASASFSPERGHGRNRRLG